MENQTLREQLESRRTQLHAERESWIEPWKELRDYIEPTAGRFEGEKMNDGKRRGDRIINNSPTMAAQILAAGMHSGMTNPASPWFKLEAPDPGLNEYGPVRNWLFTVQKVMEGIFVRSNLYNALPTCYGEQGVFGQGVICAVADDDEVVRFYNFTVGTYMLATSSRQKVDVLYRDFHMTPRQMAQQFGKDNLSPTTKQLLEKGTETWVCVCHAIEPNDNYRPGRAQHNTRMKYRSVYWERGSDRNKVLRSSGLNRFNVMAARWDVKGDNVYGKGPGSTCIGDVKALQLAELRSHQLVDKVVSPPLAVPASLRNQGGVSLLPGGVTYITDSQIGIEAKPLFQVDTRAMPAIASKIQESERRIDEAFYVDLFLMISRMDNVRTATEILARKEEKMLMLGPVLERQNDELLDLIIDVTFNMMFEQSLPIWNGLVQGRPLIPPPPQELVGMDLRVEYTSILAQASKQIGASTIERAFAFTGSLAQSFPDVADLINVDAAVSSYYTAVGVDPRVLRDEKEVAAIRQGRADAAAQAQQTQQMAQIAEGAKLLSETDMGGNNALTQLAGGI